MTKPTCTPKFRDEALDEWADKLAEKAVENDDGTVTIPMPDGKYSFVGDEMTRLWERFFGKKDEVK